MRAYIIRRLFLIIPTLFLITVLVFLLVRFVPGDVIDMMLAQMSEQSGMGAELTADYLRQAMGLDQPILKQLRYSYAKFAKVIICLILLSHLCLVSVPNMGTLIRNNVNVLNVVLKQKFIPV